MAPNNRSRNSDSRHIAPLDPAICDYEGSKYRTEFWTPDRSYEDAVERIALQALLPPSGRRLIEIGAGFGRLVDLYAGYEQVILFDYSRSMLQEARALWGDAGPGGHPRYLYVVGDMYNLPFLPGVFDAATMIRVIHHAQDAPRVIRGVEALLSPGGTFVLEFANKRNLKAILRWLVGRQGWNPFDREPYEFVELNFDFHPHWIQACLREAGLEIKTQRSVSHFRLGSLKELVPTRYLAKLDGLVQPTGRWWQFAPSIFVKSQATRPKSVPQKDRLFRCPACHSLELVEQNEGLNCQTCQRHWPVRDGLYDFKASG